MADSAHEAAREWVGDQLRYPQRLPRTAIVVNWSSVPQPVQRRLEEVVRAGGSIDYSRLPRRRWWQGRGLGLSADEVRVVESAATSLRWPATLDNDETRLLTVVEGIVDRIAMHPAWQHPVAYGHRSVVALHMELHDFAATTYELLQLRCATPEVPAHTGPDSYVRQEWDRRQVAFAHSRSALIERAVSLRLVEQALDRVHRLAEERRAAEELAVGTLVIDRLSRHLAAADVASLNAQITANDLDAAAANLRAQIAYLSTVDS
ncbi:hypothetical protein [Rhodococcus sp. YH1]|uniref:hypothetical protein n=1 Tax=Rhodococcus sp. YH1 TaxID=89066 RepID=UPI001386D21F|nr:hypothetical protein [Rhodococcus sp. YH1]NCL78723.1 hypothetical protein [Rhodococcus sp. YH1]